MAQELPDRERLIRAEVHLSTIGDTITEVKTLLVDLRRHLEAAYVPRAELDQRFAAMENRLGQVERRGSTIPGWVPLIGSGLISLVALLLGILLRR